MADVKITELPAAATTGDTDVLAGVQGGVTKKFGLGVILAWLKTRFTASDVGAQPTITANGILKGDGAGGVSAAVAGTDYGTYSKPSGGIPASDLASGVIPAASTADPAMDGTASPGSTGTWADGGHVHPTDTSRQAVITANGLLKGDGAGTISRASENFDYVYPTTISTQENGATSHVSHNVGDLFFRDTMLCQAIAPIAVGDSFNSANFEYVNLNKVIASKAGLSQLAVVETGSTASRDYLPGERFTWNGILYRAKTAISSGATFTPGTNCEATTVAAELGIPCEWVVPSSTLFSSIFGSAQRVGNVVVFAFQATTDGALANNTEILRIPYHAPTVNGQVITLLLGNTANTARINGGIVSSVSYARFYTNTAVSAGVKLTIAGSYFIS